jgi:recombination protein RecA
MSMAREKVEKKGVEAILAELEKRYGLERKKLESNIVVSTGSIQLNVAMGIGGTALGKIIEIFGPESSGKSTITLHQMAEYQKAFPERKVALFDYEHSFDKGYAKSLGVDVDNLLIYQPDDQESGYDMIIELVKNQIVSCIVVDSQTAASPKAIINGEMGDATIGLQARNNSKFCLKIKGLLDINKATLFFISQTRDAIGGMGESTTTTGGKAIRFYSDVRWKVWKMNDKANELNKTTVDVVKNKLDKPFGQAKIDILWGIGFDSVGEIIDYASDFGLIKKGGAWYTLDEDIKLQGMDALKEFFEDNPERFLKLKEDVLSKLNKTEENVEG